MLLSCRETLVFSPFQEHGFRVNQRDPGAKKTAGWLQTDTAWCFGNPWSHGIRNDFPETVGNFIIPTHEQPYFSEG